MQQSTAGQPASRLGRLGGWAADHSRAVAIVWLGIVIALGALAPFADRALSGAGWEAVGSESVAARSALEARFPGAGSYALSVVVAGRRDDPALRATVARVVTVLRSDDAVSGVPVPQRSRDGSSAVVLGLAGGRPDEMVEAAGRLKSRLTRLSADGIAVRLTGPAAMWSDFNAENKAAMLKSELLSWPLTLVLLVFAFGTLVAAGLPLLLTMAGLLGAGGSLFILGQFADVSIWAMNFAMMFAIALGIDYALFIVVRFRSALAAGLSPREATTVTMATAGKAVLVSGLTVIAALLALTLVPVPAFRTVPIGIGLAVTMVLAATLTLLPAVLARLGDRINGGRVRMRGAVDHRSERFAVWGARLWARPLPYGTAAIAILLALAAPALGLRTGMPTAAALGADAGSRQGQELLERAFGNGAASALQIVVREPDAAAARSALERDRGITAVAPVERSHGVVLLTAIPDAAGLNATIDRVRDELPPGALLGGPAAETRDLERALASRLPIVVGVALGLGFLLLLALLRAPIAAAAAVAMSLLATAAAFGVARLVFQEGVLDHLLGWESQGFVDAWAPIFFFALIFALAMDYTVFLLATVKAVFDRTGDARQALVEGLTGTGRVINAAAGVMVVVFMTFALAGPIAPREMGVILAVAVLLDATLIRLLLQPVVLRLLGARAWWMPAWLDRLVPDVGPGHEQPVGEPAPGQLEPSSRW
ncbi:MMPL family transporter [Solirubrobacter ginsenosidimutans]|uniref:MMPL family transporter n=1 Tax=Solirubrobacter ginsenosidimutans TaxID=490573 RepID=A0A9X3S5D3_9ACTN|nr:MMPL family transporter [Solirubrobacter ginsenosidimutans]MDA0164056.1 MMPL family transporter [Solirubrobacter ginsenosidimutans]